MPSRMPACPASPTAPSSMRYALERHRVWERMNRALWDAGVPRRADSAVIGARRTALHSPYPLYPAFCTLKPDLAKLYGLLHDFVTERHVTRGLGFRSRVPPLRSQKLTLADTSSPGCRHAGVGACCRPGEGPGEASARGEGPFRCGARV